MSEQTTAPTADVHLARRDTQLDAAEKFIAALKAIRAPVLVEDITVDDSTSVDYRLSLTHHPFGPQPNAGPSRSGSG